MSNVPALVRREFNAYFASVMGYVVIMFFLIVMGVTFVTVVNYLNEGPRQLTAMKILFSMAWLPSIIVVPAITMRLLAEEKRSGSIELLMTAPVTDFEVVFAKWLGAVLFYSLMWALTAFYVVILKQFSAGTASLDFGAIACGYVGVFLIGQFLVAIGLLASSTTKNQVGAVLMSFALIFIFVIVIQWMTFLFQGGPLNKLFRFLSTSEYMDDFARGVFDLRPVVLYVSATGFVLFLTTRIVESRKWR